MTNKLTSMIVGVLAAVVLLSFLGYLLFYGGSREDSLMLATTTSTHDSGLLDYILPAFEGEFNCSVSVIAVGSGQAMQLGRDGDADVLLVHSPSEEEEFVEHGYGDHRIEVMYNSFVIVGPETDPGRIGDASNVSDAFQRIYESGEAGTTRFISRADDSGTYEEEISIWSALGFDEAEVEAFDGSWYIQAQTGMGAVLDMCEEMEAYTLSDDATYYSRVSQNLIPHLNMTFSGDPELFNQYSVIAVNATDRPHINRALALDFIEWITSRDGQSLIASYEKYGHQLFFPNAPNYIDEVNEQEMSVEQLRPVEPWSSPWRSNDRPRDAFGL